MTEKRIYDERPDIREKVMAEYPSPKEKPCPIRQAKLNKLRWWMAKKLYEENGTHTGTTTDTAAL